MAKMNDIVRAWASNKVIFEDELRDEGFVILESKVLEKASNEDWGLYEARVRHKNSKAMRKMQQAKSQYSDYPMMIKKNDSRYAGYKEKYSTK